MRAVDLYSMVALQCAARRTSGPVPEVSCRLDALCLAKRLANSGSPVFDTQPGHEGEVGVSGDDGTVAQAEGDGGNLDVDRLHGTASPAQLGEEPAIFASRFRCEGPEAEKTEISFHDLEVCARDWLDSTPAMSSPRMGIPIPIL